MRISFIDPAVAATWNSNIPVSFNDGAMWAGRGLNVTASAGVQAWYRNIRVIVDPQVVTSQNLQFPIIPSGITGRSGFASPWHPPSSSADLPLRFGDRRYTRLDPGETTVDVTASAVAFGVTSAESWWGPGIHNALLMSNNAAGIPQAYLRTAAPVRTRFGAIEVRWLIGGLQESPFFDSNPGNDFRSISAGVITLRVAADTGLTIGAARAVYASVPRIGGIPSHVADLFTDWHRPVTGDTAGRASDQLLSLFARWVVPEAGVAAHFEWAKIRMPASLGELIVAPQIGQGYTLGLEWARPIGALTTVRIQGEVTDLEQTPESAGAIIPEFYVSASVPQGYTQQGQSIGATIGPGSSGQYIDASVTHSNWQLRANLGRIRWEEDAYYREPSEGRFTYKTHDVSVFGGVGARYDSRWAQVDASFLRTLRMNYLFQTFEAAYEQSDFDVRNTTMSIAFTPHLTAFLRR